MIYNPLDTVVPDSKLVSTSSLDNDDIGICPKCRHPFSSGQAAGDLVYFCESCHVTEPKPE